MSLEIGSGFHNLLFVIVASSNYIFVKFHNLLFVIVWIPMLTAGSPSSVDSDSIVGYLWFYKFKLLDSGCVFATIHVLLFSLDSLRGSALLYEKFQPFVIFHCPLLLFILAYTLNPTDTVASCFQVHSIIQRVGVH
jgi:hypothetical protein